jgi:hypothetical protein
MSTCEISPIIFIHKDQPETDKNYPLISSPDKREIFKRGPFIQHKQSPRGPTVRPTHIIAVPILSSQRVPGTAAAVLAVEE